jgi:hypothetical protein
MIYVCYTIFIAYMALGMILTTSGLLWSVIFSPVGNFVFLAAITLLGVIHIVYVVRKEPIYNMPIFCLVGVLWLIAGLGSLVGANLHLGQGRVLSVIAVLDTLFIVYSIAVDKPFYFAKIEHKTTGYIVWKRLMVWGFVAIWLVSSVLPFLRAHYGAG